MSALNHTLVGAASMVTLQTINTVNIPIITFEKHRVMVKLLIKYSEAGTTWIAAEFNPVDMRDSLYGKELPMEGVNGIGRPTRLEVSGQLALSGGVVSSVFCSNKTFEDIEGDFPMYPPGSVALYQGVTIPDTPVITFDVAVTYMACSDRGICLPPVMGHTVHVEYDTVERRVISLAGVPELKFDAQTDPSEELSAATAEATANKRRILLKVGGDWCIWCHRLDHFIEAHADLDRLLHDHYVVQLVNYSPENRNEAFLAQYPPVAGYPHLFVLDSDGSLLHSQDTEALESGTGLGYDEERLREFLTKWSLTSG
jgi:hypothetical protein